MSTAKQFQFIVMQIHFYQFIGAAVAAEPVVIDCLNRCICQIQASQCCIRFKCWFWHNNQSIVTQIQIFNVIQVFTIRTWMCLSQKKQIKRQNCCYHGAVQQKVAKEENRKQYGLHTKHYIVIPSSENEPVELTTFMCFQPGRNSGASSAINSVLPHIALSVKNVYAHFGVFGSLLRS